MAGDTPGLTPLELELLDLTGKLSELLHQVIGPGPRAVDDWNELIPAIHLIQRTVMANAAARCYPERFRLLGGTLQR